MARVHSYFRKFQYYTIEYDSELDSETDDSETDDSETDDNETDDSETDDESTDSMESWDDEWKEEFDNVERLARRYLHATDDVEEQSSSRDNDNEKKEKFDDSRDDGDAEEEKETQSSVRPHYYLIYNPTAKMPADDDSLFPLHKWFYGERCVSGTELGRLRLAHR